jgi:catechol 2,3-dioxygenase-like lactoylglutathione lyase family enzyme
MLSNKDAVANVAVKDLDVASDFYRNTLGLKPVHTEGKELVVFESGHSSINVYRSDYAGTNKATAVTWTVDNVDDEVKALKNKGVVFEHYDMPGLKREGDVHVGMDMRIAWFKDPDGNILNVVSK